MCDLNSSASGNDAASHNNILALQKHLEDTLNARVEPFTFQMLASMPPDITSFRFIRGEQGFKVTVSGIGGEALSAALLQKELLLAANTLMMASRRLSTPGIVEILVVKFISVTRNVVDSRLPLPLVKRLLIYLVYLQCSLSGRIKGAQKYHCARLQALSYLLQEPQTSVTSLMRQHQYFLYWNFARRLRHLRRSDSDVPDSQGFNWPARDSYSEMNRQCNESRVLVTIHMGDFFGAFKCIAGSLKELRPVISLRREGDSDAIKNLSRQHAEGHQVFMHGKDSPLKIVRALRAGGQTLSALFDLSDDFGETTEVIFFGHRARFVRGPAELAIAGKARIYPFVCFSDLGRDCIHMESAVSPEVRPGETMRNAVARVTQTLVAMAERWIRQHPAQWKYLDRLPSYLVADAHGDDRHA